MQRHETLGAEAAERSSDVCCEMVKVFLRPAVFFLSSAVMLLFRAVLYLASMLVLLSCCDAVMKLYDAVVWSCTMFSFTVWVFLSQITVLLL